MFDAFLTCCFRIIPSSRRWLREDASNRGRGSNLERRLAGNTGNLRTFLFGADAKLDTTKVGNIFPWSACRCLIVPHAVPEARHIVRSENINLMPLPMRGRKLWKSGCDHSLNLRCATLPRTIELGTPHYSGCRRTTSYSPTFLITHAVASRSYTLCPKLSVTLTSTRSSHAIRAKQLVVRWRCR